MFLYINSRQAEWLTVAVVGTQGRILELKKMRAKYRQSEKLLVSIEELVGKRPKKLKGVMVVKGPGSFTALRIGLTTANMLAWSLSVPVVGLELNDELSDEELIAKAYRQIIKRKKFKPVWPVYGREPNITIKRQE